MNALGLNDEHRVNEQSTCCGRQARRRLCRPRFTSTRRTTGTHINGLAGAARLGGEVDSHLGSLNKSTLWVSVNTCEGWNHDADSVRCLAMRLENVVLANFRLVDRASDWGRHHPL